MIGRFAIVDDSGVAVVDTADFDLSALERVVLDQTVVAVRAGDIVDAVGRIHPIDAPEAAPLAPATYRDRAAPVGISGTRRGRLAIVVRSIPPARATLARDGEG
jgi:hypothetical protein